MGKGKRYNGDGRLNIKKVVAVIIALILFIVVVFAIIKLFTGKKVDNKIVANEYFSSYTDGKWGVIDSKGKAIIKNTYDESIIIPNSKKDLFICTYDVNYDTEEYKTKVLNEKGKEILTDYESVQAIENYDINNNLWYAEDVLLTRKDDKYGLIDFNGKQLVKCEYDTITSLKGVKNIFITTKDKRQGLVDNIGSVIIENNYKEVKPLSIDGTDGYIVIDENEKYGIIKNDKSIVLDNKYEDIKQVYGDNKYVVKSDGKWSVVDKSGKKYLTGKFDDVTSINGNNVIVKNGKKYGVMSIDGEQKLKSEYDELIYTYENNYIAKKDKKYGVINIDGGIKIKFIYDNLVYRKTEGFFEGSVNSKIDNDLIDRDFQVKLSGIISTTDIENGFIKVRTNDEYKYYNFKFEEKTSTDVLKGNTLFLKKQGEKYGFVNKDGVVIVNYIYDDATEQNKFGYASVKKDGLWGSIDSKGNEVVKPQYKMENNVLIEFIDKWHLGEDLNLNYYTK